MYTEPKLLLGIGTWLRSKELSSNVRSVGVSSVPRKARSMYVLARRNVATRFGRWLTKRSGLVLSVNFAGRSSRSVRAMSRDGSTAQKNAIVRVLRLGRLSGLGSLAVTARIGRAGLCGMLFRLLVKHTHVPLPKSSKRSTPSVERQNFALLLCGLAGKKSAGSMLKRSGFRPCWG